MKKHEKILKKLQMEKKSLERYHHINDVAVNDYTNGKLDIIDELIKYINGLK